jgi:alkanesulfonate monooxygenase SsuD/methylene tetrahydromethanopterin reductase-like flavin-dependent oxidoreductase (luciferase family)
VTIRFGVGYDFRNPASSPLTVPEVYARSLEQIREVDDLGFDSVWLSEHHFVDDGYLPSLLPMCGAIAAVTRRVMIGQDVLLVPFQHPVRLAEDLCVLDNLSGGRIMLGAGMGYVPGEFAAMGVNRSHRVSIMDESLEIVTRAWREECFSYHGKRFTLDDVRVRPRPVQADGLPLWVASMSEGGARRAARFGAHLLPQGDHAAVLDPWRQAVRDAGRDPDAHRVAIVRPFRVTDAPQPDVPPAPTFGGEGYTARMYREWFAQVDDRMTRQLAEGARTGRTIPQSLFAGDAAQCIAEIERFTGRFGITDIILWGSHAGDDPADHTPNLRRFAREVIPHFS